MNAYMYKMNPLQFTTASEQLVNSESLQHTVSADPTYLRNAWEEM